MKTLSDHWLTEGLVDFEYKKYTLLAWLKQVEAEFGAVRVFPSLSDLVHHYRNLEAFREGKRTIQGQFPKEISTADLNRLSFEYRSLVADDGQMRELEDIVDFSLPQMKQYLEQGQAICRHVEEQISITPIGLLPLRREEGFMLLHFDRQSDVDVYGYRLSLLEAPEGNYRALSLQHLERVTHSLTQTFEQIKINLIKKHKELPNPATYLVESRVQAPIQETLLPLTKRMLVRYVLTS